MSFDEGWRFVAIMAGLHTIMTLLVWAVYAQLHKRELFPTWRIDDGKAPPEQLARSGVMNQPFVQIGFALVLGAAVYPTWSLMGGSMESEWPGLLTLGWQLLVCILGQDTIFYWSHRFLHHKKLFRLIHRKHHGFRHCRPYMATYAHTVEDLANVIAFFAPPVLLGASWQVFAIWIAIRTWETYEAHSGYGFTAIASRHAYHHLHATKGCLGSFWGVWDRIMGTDANWREWQKEQTHR
ncbi:MAG: sterol desaturase family protein [Proteobacteria bacterium]|nr:sterol desaturase family protein [Pseudomonadota bacterium]MCP4916234.1 sterol desaturase family protein [Pseudomonadota bacterium]